MVTHVIYGFFGLLAASVIALAIYLDKPAPGVSATPELQEEGALVDTQVAAAEVAGSTAELFEVIKVIDGDTISIRKGGSTETVRFIGINAPETGQCFTNEATQKLKNILAGGLVGLELDPSQGERDKYDRLLAYVFNESGTNTAGALIEGGFAKEYTYSRAYKYQTEFKTAQANAQAGEKGLWAQGACSTPAPTSVPVQTQPAIAPVVEPTEPATAKQKPAPVEKKEEPVEEEEQADEEDEEDQPPTQSTSGYTCSSNAYNCTDFSTHDEAQAVFDACGGASNDIHRLDANKDGQACESLP